MTAADAARIFHDWALSEGLMVDSPVAVSSSPAELLLVSPASEPGKSVLRHKQVLAIGFCDQSKEILVYTRLAAPRGKKALQILPSLIDDVRVKYRQGGSISAAETPASPFGAPPYSIRALSGGRFYACGSSISVGTCVDAGTLAALVRDPAGVLYGLSNNHVTGSCSCAEPGLPILAPGIADVSAISIDPFTLGRHSAALPMVCGSPSMIPFRDNSDAALFTISNAQIISSFQGSAYDTPASAAPLTAGIEVQKVGRTTGLTRGFVTSQLFGPVAVAYKASRYGFSGNIFFENVFAVEGIGQLFSDNGDSGSLVVTEKNGALVAVGLVFAGMPNSGAPGGKLSLILPIEPILQKLGVTLVSGHNA